MEQLKKEIANLGVLAWEITEEILRELHVNLSEAGKIEMWKKVYDTLIKAYETSLLDEALELIERKVSRCLKQEDQL